MSSSEFIRILRKREVNWCESGHGYPAYCPGPSDPASYKYCCTYPYLGSFRPSCCSFPIEPGVLAASCVIAIVLFLLMLSLYCWCWPRSLLNRRRQRNLTIIQLSRDEVGHRRNSYKSSIPFN